VNNFYKLQPILIIFWHTVCWNNWLLHACKIFDLTLAMLLHNLRNKH